MHDESRSTLPDDFDFIIPDNYWDGMVATDFATTRDARRVARNIPSEKLADFWRRPPWEKPLGKTKGKTKGKKAKPRVAKKAPHKPDASAAQAPKLNGSINPSVEPAGPLLEPDRATIRAHLEFLSAPARDPDPTKYPEHLIEIAYDHAGDGDPNRAQLFDISAGGLDAAADFAAGVNGDGLNCNVYVGVCLKKAKTPRGHRTNASHSCIITAMPADIDHDAEETNAKLAAIATPEVTVRTGTTPELRQQKWMRLAKPCTDMGLVKHAFDAVVEHIGGDTNATGLNRLMRLAGSVSRPSEKKRARGYIPELTTLEINADAPPVDIKVFADLMPREESRASKFPRSPRVGNGAGGDDTFGLSPNDLASMMEAIPNDDREFSDCPDYEVWLKVGAALHHETGGTAEGFNLFNAWSAKHSTYDEKKTIKTWESFNKPYSGTRATAATLMAMALPTGWYPQDPTASDAAPEDDSAKAKPVKVETPAPDREPEPEPAGAKFEQAADPEPPPDGAAHDAKREQAKAQGGSPSGASTPSSIFDPWEQFIVPALPMDVFDNIPALRDFAMVMAESFGCDPAALAMSALTALGITHETTLSMNDDGGYLVSACLWVMLVAASGEMKTPVFKEVTAPLLKLEREEFAEYQKDHDWWESADENARGPEPLAPSPLVHNDCTIEALGIELAKDPRGALTLRDEIPGWLGSMERYDGAGGAAADRAAWLQARTGGSHRVGRVTRKGGLIANLSSSLLGGVQPQKLAEIKGLTSDGLLQRFIPVMQHKGRFGNRHTDTRAARAKYEQLVRECHRAPATIVHLSPDAADAMWELRKYLHDLGGAMSGASDAMANFINKLPGVAGNLTLILHIAANPDRVYRPVERRVVDQVSRLIHEYILPHAMEFYRVIGVSWNGELLRKIASYILTSGKTEFRPSDFTNNVAALVGKEVPELVRAVSPLSAVGWLDLDNRKPTAPRWKLCPGVAEAMATRRETEEREKQALAELMNSNRRGRRTQE
jgi:hypothetical protein